MEVIILGNNKYDVIDLNAISDLEIYKSIFLNELKISLVSYNIKLSNKEKLGADITEYKFRAYLLSQYYKILVDYINVADEEDQNFFTTTEARDCLEHFNKIANSNITYSLFE